MNEENKKTKLQITPVCHVSETDKGWLLAVELPGVAPDAIDLETENRTLKLCAENAPATYDGFARVLHEAPSVCWKATFELPEHADADALSASCKNGVLLLDIPRQTTTCKRKIAITA